jgi:hypothetical protein
MEDSQQSPSFPSAIQGDMPVVLGIGDLTSLADDEFRTYITNHLRVDHSEVNRHAWLALTDASVVERTRAVLVRMQDQLDNSIRRKTNAHKEFQLECFAKGARGRSAWLRADAEFKTWRGKAVTFRWSIAERLRFIRDSLAAARRTVGDSLAGYRSVVRDLALAVERHRHASLASEIVPEGHDRQLWSTLDSLTVPVGPQGKPATLNSMIECYWAHHRKIDS